MTDTLETRLAEARKTLSLGLHGFDVAAAIAREVVAEKDKQLLDMSAYTAEFNVSLGALAQMRKDLAEKDKDLTDAKAFYNGVIDKLEAALAEKEAEIARLKAAHDDKVREIARLEVDLERAREELNSWDSAMQYVLAEPKTKAMQGALREEDDAIRKAVKATKAEWEAALAEPRKVSDAQRKAIARLLFNGPWTLGPRIDAIVAIIESPADVEATT